MSFLSDVFSYWSGNATLNAALPVSKVYLGVQPSGAVLPYGVIVVIGSIPTFTTGKPYYEVFSFQISLFDNSAASVEATAQTVMQQFDYQPVASGNMACIRTDYQCQPDTSTPQIVYQAIISYDLYANRSLI